MDAHLHPLLTKHLVSLFDSTEFNPKGAQLIFTSHSTNLLDLDFLRRDQIWFTEKDEQTAATDLFSLYDFSIRKDTKVEKGYLIGRFGAIPFIKGRAVKWHGDKIEKRGQRRRKLKPVILIVTEGSQTEPKYFEHYRSRQTNIDIRVVGSHTKGGETDYLALIRKAVEYQSKNQLSVSNGDAVWVVADGDVNYNTPDPIAAKDKLLSKAQKMADAKGIHIALSNPCFEFWYLLHFQYTTKFFKDYPAVKNALTTYLPDYEKTGDVYSQLSAHTTNALQNAKRVEQYHLQNGSSKPFGIAVNPFTDIYQLVESLL